MELNYKIRIIRIGGKRVKLKPTTYFASQENPEEPWEAVVQAEIRDPEKEEGVEKIQISRMKMYATKEIAFVEAEKLFNLLSSK